MYLRLLALICSLATVACDEGVSDSIAGPTGAVESYFTPPNRSRPAGECITNPDHRVRLEHSYFCQRNMVGCVLLYNALFRNGCPDDAQIRVLIAVSVFRGGVRMRTITYLIHIDPNGEEWMCGDGSGDCFAEVSSSDPLVGDFQVKWSWRSCWTWFHPTQGFGCYPDIDYPNYPD